MQRKRRNRVCAILALVIAFLFTGAVLEKQKNLTERTVNDAQKVLADEVLRLHVLANSDSKADQNVKLLVRDAVRTYISKYIPEEAEKSSETVKLWAGKNLDQIEKTANEVLIRQGYSYAATAKITNAYFPDRKYGNMLYPKGRYEALRIELGQASGQNWWCVLYPNLCFTEAVCEVVREDEEDTEQEAVTAASDFEIKSFFLELFAEKTK